MKETKETLITYITSVSAKEKGFDWQTEYYSIGDREPNNDSLG
jgi:hypothetical protein